MPPADGQRIFEIRRTPLLSHESGAVAIGCAAEELFSAELSSALLSFSTRQGILEVAPIALSQGLVQLSNGLRFAHLQISLINVITAVDKNYWRFRIRKRCNH